MKTEILAWHFLRKTKKLGFSDGRAVTLGETLTVNPEELDLCNFGLHGSVKIINALTYVYWTNAVVCRVKLSGKIIEYEDKCVASERTVVSWCEADKILHEFACRVAEDVLPLFEEKYPDDNRPRKALESKRLWIDGKISEEELAAARWAVARDVDINSDVNARRVALTVVNAVSITAAWATSWNAVNYAVTNTADWDKYNGWLEEMVSREVGNG